MKKLMLVAFLFCFQQAQANVTPVTDAIVTPDVLGEGWQQTFTGGLLGQYILSPTVPHTVSIGLSDGSWAIFDMILNPSVSPLEPIQITNATFSLRSGPVSTLTSIPSGQSLWVSGGVGPVQLYDIFFDIFDPKQYVYTLGGQAHLLDKGTGMIAIPAPTAIFLGSIGVGFVTWLRRCKKL